MQWFSFYFLVFFYLPLSNRTNIKSSILHWEYFHLFSFATIPFFYVWVEIKVVFCIGSMFISSALQTFHSLCLCGNYWKQNSSIHLCLIDPLYLKEQPKYTWPEMNIFWHCQQSSDCKGYV